MTTASKSERGFALTELMVVGSLAAIALVLISLGCTGNYYSARESETKANLHEIATALERYSTDHHGIYPNYIYGGDARGWDVESGCRSIRTAVDEAHRPAEDPLIKFGYLSEYPINPFLDTSHDNMRADVPNGISPQLGDGDVRFGWSGDRMGNCLDDPRFLFDAPGHPTRMQYTMSSDATKGIVVLREGLPNSFYVMGGYPADASDKLDGTIASNKGTLRYWWPGNFFYRIGGDFFVGCHYVEGVEYEYIWGWPYMRYDRFILGCYGYTNQDGIDVVRLTTKDGMPACFESSAISGYLADEYYQDHTDYDRRGSHPDNNALIQYSNPEVFGGGERGLMPQFPYYTDNRSSFLYGAPDGFSDGIILVQVNSRTDGIIPTWADQVSP